MSTLLVVILGGGFTYDIVTRVMTDVDSLYNTSHKYILKLCRNVPIKSTNVRKSREGVK